MTPGKAEKEQRGHLRVKLPLREAAAWKSSSVFQLPEILDTGETAMENPARSLSHLRHTWLGRPHRNPHAYWKLAVVLEAE